jgi:cobalt-zinc-cadmium efflux system outer membrane protein
LREFKFAVRGTLRIAPLAVMGVSFWLCAGLLHGQNPPARPAALNEGTPKVLAPARASVENVFLFAQNMPASPGGSASPAAGSNAGSKTSDSGALPQAVTLQQAIDEAIAHNLDLAVERFNVSVAEAKQITAALRPNPVLTLSGQTLNVFRLNLDSNSPLGPNAYTAHTDFVLERANKRQNRIEVARTERSVAELQTLEVMRQLIFNVQNAFVDVQQAKDSLALAQLNLQSLNGIVTINEIRVNSGDLAQVELERSRLAALQFQTSVEQAQLAVEQAKAKLQLLMGRRSPTTMFDVVGTLRQEPVADSADETRAKALTRRPDVLLQQAGNARSQADLRLQIANGKVDYTVGAEVTRQSAFGVAGQTMGFTFSTPLPLFNKNQGEIARAQREIQQNGARVMALGANLSADVDAAYRQYTVSQRLLANIEKNLLPRAESVRQTTEYSYRRGEASLVEFLDAQRAFNDAMQSYNEARVNYARSLYQIDTVSGATTAAALPPANPAASQSAPVSGGQSKP